MSSSEGSFDSAFTTYPEVTPSGIIHDHYTGKSYVPSSTRPDGTERKEITVRPGYQPKEDMVLYKSVAARMAAHESFIQNTSCSPLEANMDVEIDVPYTTAVNPFATDLRNAPNTFAPAMAKEEQINYRRGPSVIPEGEFTVERALDMLEAQARYQPPGRRWRPDQQRVHDIFTNYEHYGLVRVPKKTYDELPKRGDKDLSHLLETNDQSQRFGMQEMQQEIQGIEMHLNKGPEITGNPARGQAHDLSYTWGAFSEQTYNSGSRRA
ncbi:hypothetical protein MYU51_015879 [Penicillium brevicompactum]|uniref:uncharacterized protein n=1 Tax=Penicillium brevicompactum TaxID=5074 RepID=UPI0025411E5A|nr:uncharacterized protein N7506_011375 [Penicillium brevicompactum]KAJ5322245.1 hypothetical protein N7506_011375 [Penicillium brevicompactum]